MVRHSVRHGIPITYIIRSEAMIVETDNNNNYRIKLKAPEVGTAKFLMTCQGIYSCTSTTASTTNFQTQEFRIDLPSYSHDTINDSPSNIVGIVLYDTLQKTYVSHLPFQKVINFSGESIYNVTVYEDGQNLATTANVPAHIISLSLTPIYED